MGQRWVEWKEPLRVGPKAVLMDSSMVELSDWQRAESWADQKGGYWVASMVAQWAWHLADCWDELTAVWTAVVMDKSWAAERAVQKADWMVSLQEWWWALNLAAWRGKHWADWMD